MHAYNMVYLDDAMDNLGEAFDYAANRCHINLDEFFGLFVAVGVADQFGKGVPSYVSGHSGTELAMQILENAGKRVDFPRADISFDCSPEYWCGWALAYFQWYSGRSFRNIRKYISMQEMLKLYPTLHEASEDRVVDSLTCIIERADSVTELQALRRLLGYSQRILAEKSGVSLRMIQQYEQRTKDINKASGSNLLALSRTLGCRMEDLLEDK